MGISTGQNPLTGKWCICCRYCDHCTGEFGETGERVKDVKRINCPHNYCGTEPVCNQCRKAGKHKEQSHESCRLANIEYEQRQQKQTQLQAEGKLIKVAAIGYGDQVKVLFRGQDDKEKAYFMHSWTYGAIPLLVVATPEDYQQHGQLEECQNTDLSDGEKYAEIKQVIR